MVLYFSQEELSFVAKQFGYKHLEGADLIRYNKSRCIASLTDKGYILPYGKKYELSNECRLMLSAWESMRYTLVKESCLLDSHVHAILANSRYIISYSFHHDDIQIAMCDFSVEVMDKIIADYINIDKCDNFTSGFNITFSGDEYLECFEKEVSNDVIGKKTGLSLEDVSLIKQTLAEENSVSFIVQDIVEDIGCMGVLVKYPSGYVLIKHIVPNNEMKKQKVVVIKGDCQDIVDSIYIL